MNDIVVIDAGTDITAMSVVDEINHEHELFMGCMQGGFQHAMRCGELLARQKEKTEWGDWQNWVLENCKFRLTQSKRYMQIYAYFSNRRRGDDIDDVTSFKHALRIIAAEDKKSKPVIQEDTRDLAFSWMKEENILAMMDGMKDVKTGVSMLLRADKDVGVAAYLLKLMRKSMVEMVRNINGVLGEE